MMLAKYYGNKNEKKKSWGLKPKAMGFMQSQT